MKCPRTVNDGKDRCPWEGDEAVMHDGPDGLHMPCLLGGHFLRDHEVRVCNDCIGEVRDDLTALTTAYVDLHAAFAQGAYRRVRDELLAILGDGSTQGGGPDDALSFHDPCSAAAQLEQLERDWREEFGHGAPDYPPLGAGKWQSRRPVHVFGEAKRYLEAWHPLAARTHPGFDDAAAEIRSLRFRLELAAGEIDFPRRDPLPCECGGKLVQDYAEEGLSDERRCRDCGTVYPPGAYAFHMRLLTDTPGWVSLEQAHRLTKRPIVTLKAWASSLALPSVCNRLTRRLLVEEEAVLALHEERATRRRAG